MHHTTIQRIRPQSQWSDAVIHAGTAYFVEVPENGEDINSQTREVLAQAEQTLALCHSDKSLIVMATIYLKHMHERTAFNAIWQDWLPDGCAPARVCVSAEMANPLYLLEIAFTAAVIPS